MGNKKATRLVTSISFTYTLEHDPDLSISEIINSLITIHNKVHSESRIPRRFDKEKNSFDVEDNPLVVTSFNGLNVRTFQKQSDDEIEVLEF